MKWARLTILLFVIACLAGALVTPVQAHALPVRTIPPANAVLPRPPAQIEIYFNQAVDPTFSKIKVLDENGNRVDAGDVTLDPADNTHLVVSMQAVKDGVYTVVWTALSAADGHQTTGSFPFAVGNENASALASAPQASGSSSLTALEVISKALLYLAVAALTGGILFSNLVWKPSLRQAGIPALPVQQVGAYPRNTRRLAIGAVDPSAGYGYLQHSHPGRAGLRAGHLAALGPAPRLDLIHHPFRGAGPGAPRPGFLPRRGCSCRRKTAGTAGRDCWPAWRWR